LVPISVVVFSYYLRIAVSWQVITVSYHKLGHLTDLWVYSSWGLRGLNLLVPFSTDLEPESSINLISCFAITE